VLAFTDGDVWRPEIGDPTVMGWLTVVAYFLVAALCFHRAREASFPASKRTEVLFWTGLGGLLVFLGINKQLDLQTWLTLLGRRVAIAEGWYDHRRTVQLIFVALISLAAVGSLVFIWRLVRTHAEELWISLAGFVLLLGFVIIRAASFHHVDAMINFDLAGVRMNWLIELGAIAFIGIGALWKTRRKATDSPNIGSPPKAAMS
jgi:hypothetical protein